jgi:hypothetical protein
VVQPSDALGTTRLLVSAPCVGPPASTLTAARAREQASTRSTPSLSSWNELAILGGRIARGRRRARVRSKPAALAASSTQPTLLQISPEQKPRDTTGAVQTHLLWNGRGPLWATFPVASAVARGEGSGAVSTRRERVYERDTANAVTLFV